MESYRSFLDAAHLFADDCRSIINSVRERGYSQELKLDRSIVTTADKDAESKFRENVTARFPSHGILGEEFGLHQSDAEYRWVIDPIDGTEDFVRGLPGYCTIIGLFFKGTPIVGIIDLPALNQRYYAAKGLGAFCGERQIKIQDFPSGYRASGEEFIHLPPRGAFFRYGGNAEVFDKLASDFPKHRVIFTGASHVYALTGGFDATIEWNLRIWDLAAAQILIEEAGGAYKTLRRSKDSNGEILSVVMGKPKLVAAIAEIAGVK